MTSSENLRSSSELVQKITFFNTRGQEGLSVYVKEEAGYSLCDVDKDGETDFIVKVGDVNKGGIEITYYDKNKTPLQTALVSINENRATLDVIQLYSGGELRAWLGGGKESWSKCFSRRMSSPHGIAMTLVAGAFSGIGALSVGIGGALSCVVYNNHN